MKKIEHNVETGEITEVEFTEKELQDYERLNAEHAVFAQELAEKAIQKTALLDRLGITEEEAKLLLS